MNDFEIMFLLRLVVPIVLIAAVGGLICILHDWSITR